MSGSQTKHILLCVLDWGLGHATRCIPIIRELLQRNQRVSLAGNGNSLELLKKEFPQLAAYPIPSYEVKYSKTGFFFLNIAWQVPNILIAIRKEKNEINKLIRSVKPDTIISDNRYGCFSDKIYSVFITHQLNIQLPLAIRWSSGIVNFLHKQLIQRFNECWVPDYSQQTLTGSLTESKNLNIRYIGPLSRFRFHNVPVDQNLFVGLVSGPEPQRTLFEELLTKEFSSLNAPSVIVRGQPQENYNEKRIGRVKMISHLQADELEKLILKAGVIVSRSGYSTVMDLHALKKQKIILIPTPGQTEQEYLAHELSVKHIAFAESQNRFNLKEALTRLAEYTGFVNRIGDVNLPAEAVDSLLGKIQSK